LYLLRLGLFLGRCPRYYEVAPTARVVFK
jgi:hypothetical protein